MSEHSIEQLFDEFAIAYRRGKQPDVGSFLERAGDERDDLADMLDAFIRAVPAREPSEEEIVLMQARLEREPALLVLRRRRSMKRDVVVSALMSALGLDPKKREKVAAYYHDLEVGKLDPEPVSVRVWDVLADLLRANAHALAAVVVPKPPAPVMHRRADFSIELSERIAAVSMQAVEAPDELDADKRAYEPPPRDEIDMLFTGGG